MYLHRNCDKLYQQFEERLKKGGLCTFTEIVPNVNKSLKKDSKKEVHVPLQKLCPIVTKV